MGICSSMAKSTAISERFRHDLLSRVSYEHVYQLFQCAKTLESKEKGRRVFSTDESFLIGKYAEVIKRSNLSEWLTNSARLFSRLGWAQHRVLPIYRTNYSNQEIDEIKFTLHILLSLGCNVFLPVVDRTDFLRGTFGSPNILVAEGVFGLDGGEVYQASANELFIKPARLDLMDLFNPYSIRSWRSSNECFSLVYRKNSFSTGVVRRDPIKRYYGPFLYFIQNGRCAITGSSMDYESMQVDHIHPASKGGTNVIINLQAVDKRVNNQKSNDLAINSSRIFLDADLIRLGLDIAFPYPDLCFRTSVLNPLSPSYF